MNIQGKRLWLNLLLLALLAGLGLLAWRQVSTPETTQSRLSALTASEVRQVTITRDPGTQREDVIQLEKAGEFWRMTQPKQLAANPVRMSQLFSLLSEPVEASYDAAGRDLRQYGLKPGEVQVTFDNESLLLGMDNPVSHKRYVLHQGKLKLISESVYGLLTGRALDFASNTPVPASGKLKSVQLPKAYRNQAETLQNWQSASAIRVEELDASLPDQGAILLNLANGQTLELHLLGSKDGDLVLGDKANGIQYILPETQRAALLPQAESKP